MAQIWMDEENAGVHSKFTFFFSHQAETNQHIFWREVLQRSARKLMGDTLIQKSGKKCVLGKLDNVLHHNYNNSNKHGMTPTPKMVMPQKWPMSCAPKLSLCKETLQKQHRKQISKLTAQGVGGTLSTASEDLYARSADENDKFDLFDFMDFPSEHCLKNCHKRKFPNYCNCLYHANIYIQSKAISNVWSKPLLSDDLIYKLVHNVVADEQKYPQEIPIHLDAEDEVFEEPSPLQHKETEFDEQLDDISVELPASIEFDDFDFF